MNTDKFLPLLPMSDQQPSVVRSPVRSQRNVAAALPIQSFAYDSMAGMHSLCVVAYCRYRAEFQSPLSSAFTGCASCRKTMKATWDPDFGQQVLHCTKDHKKLCNLGSFYFGLGECASKDARDGSQSSGPMWLSNVDDQQPVTVVYTAKPSIVVTDTEQPEKPKMPIPERPHVVDNLDIIRDILAISTTIVDEELHGVVLGEYAKYAPVTTSQLLEIGQGIFSKVELNTIWLYKTVFGVDKWHLVVLHGEEEHGFYFPKIDAVGIYYTLEQVRTQLVRLSNRKSLEDTCVDTLRLPLTGDIVKRLIGAASLTREHGMENIPDAYRLSRPEEETTRWLVFHIKHFGIFIIDWPADDLMSHTELPQHFPGLPSRFHTVDRAIDEDLADAIAPGLQQGYLVELLGQLQLR